MGYRSNVGLILSQNLEAILDAVHDLKKQTEFMITSSTSDLLDFGDDLYAKRDLLEDFIIVNHAEITNISNHQSIAKKLKSNKSQKEFEDTRNITLVEPPYSIVFYSKWMKWSGGIEDVYFKLMVDHNLIRHLVRQGDEKDDFDLFKTKNSYGNILESIFDISPSTAKGTKGLKEISLQPFLPSISVIEKDDNKKLCFTKDFNKLVQSYYQTLPLIKKLEKIIQFGDVSSLKEFLTTHPNLIQEPDIKEVVKVTLKKEFDKYYKHAPSRINFLELLEVLLNNDFTVRNEFLKLRSKQSPAPPDFNQIKEMVLGNTLLLKQNNKNVVSHQKLKL